MADIGVPEVDDIVGVVCDRIEHAVRVLAVFSTVDKQLVFMVGKNLGDGTYAVYYRKQRRVLSMLGPLYELAWMAATLQTAVAKEMVKTALLKKQQEVPVEDYQYERIETRGHKAQETEGEEDEENEIDEVV